MKLVLFCLATLVARFASATSPEKIQQAFSHLPPCGLQCILPVVTHTQCQMGNITAFSECFCANLQAESMISECVLVKCNYTELVLVETAQHALCQDQPRPTQGPKVLGVYIFLAVLVIVVVSLRFWSRYVIVRKFWWDDWFLLFSSSLFLASCSTLFWGYSMGYGYHVWNVDPALNKSLYFFQWIYELMYPVVSYTTRLSILGLYLRIFPQRWLHRTIWVTFVVVTLECLTFVTLIVFYCVPTARFWDHTLEGSCTLDQHAVTLAGAIILIVEDIYCLLLPMPILLRLNMQWRKKLSLIFIMSVGVITCIASMVRLKFVLRFHYSIDQNWDLIGLSIMTQIEVALAITCVCFPSIKHLLNVWFPNFFSSTNGAMETITRLNAQSPPDQDKSWWSAFKKSLPQSWVTKHTISFFPRANEKAPYISTVAFDTLSDLEPDASMKSMRRSSKFSG